MTCKQGVCISPLDNGDTFTDYFDTADRTALCGLILDPLCDKNASALLFMETMNEHPVPLFASTALDDNISVSPLLASVQDMNNSFLQWVWQHSPSGWGLLFCSPYTWTDVCKHLRSLVLVHEIRENKQRELIFRFWDNRIFMRIAKELPQACARIMGPIQTIVTQDEHGAWFRVENASPIVKDKIHASPWYIFDEKHTELFADKIIDVLAYKVTESLYDVADEEKLPVPALENLESFVRRQIESVYPMGLNEQEQLTSYVLCALYIGEEEAFRQVSAVTSGHAEMLKSLWKKCAEKASQEENPQ